MGHRGFPCLLPIVHTARAFVVLLWNVPGGDCGGGLSQWSLNGHRGIGIDTQRVQDGCGVEWKLGGGYAGQLSGEEDGVISLNGRDGSAPLVAADTGTASPG